MGFCECLGYLPHLRAELLVLRDQLFLLRLIPLYVFFESLNFLQKVVVVFGEFLQLRHQIGQVSATLLLSSIAKVKMVECVRCCVYKRVQHRVTDDI